MWWTLPASPVLHDLRAFALVGSLALGVATAAIGWVIDPWLVWVGPLAALTLGAVFVRSPMRALPLYRAWNAAARAFAGLLSHITTLLALVLVVMPAGIGLREPDTREVESYWRRRTTQAPATYVAQHTSSPTPSRPGWARDYGHWALRSGNSWALGLMPFLLVLRGAARPSEVTVPHDIYTLY